MTGEVVVLRKKLNGQVVKVMRSPKPKKTPKCKFCREHFQPEKVGQIVCDFNCALGLIKKNNEKKEKARKKENRKAVIELNENDLKWLIKKTQVDCNAYIRERDRFEPCISCRTKKDVQYCAGHYRPQGVNSALRFNPLNIHKQCNQNCNMKKSGNLTKYRPNLIKKIGLDNVLMLENNHEVKRWTIEELKELRIMFKRLKKEAEDRNNLLV